jgi:hypothetical protein
MKKFVMNSLGAIREIEEYDEEITLRDYFAAKAMESDIANWSIEAEKTREVNFWGYEEIAKRAYTMADAMMEARK